MNLTVIAGPLPLPPGPGGLRGLFRLLEAQTRPLDSYAALRAAHGDLVRLGAIAPLAWYLVFHPDGIEHVLAHNHKNYRKGSINGQFRLLDGEGLVTSEGSFWARQRRLAQPAFHRQRLAALGHPMTQAAERMVQRWRPWARNGQSFDVVPEMLRLTLQIAGQTLFSTEISEEAGGIGQAVDVAREYLTWRMFHVWLPAWLPTVRRRRFLQARRVLDEVVYSIIRERRRAGRDTGDLLSMFLQARDEETGERMDDRQLRDEVMTMLMAGHETTAVALGWIWYLLAKHPEVQEGLHAELKRVLGGRTPTVGDLPELISARMIVEETLRLYPPVWSLSRQAIEADEIGGCRIPAGAYLILGTFLTHRHPGFWDEPDVFDPGRFAPERSASRPRFAYLPFGGGPRGCIGTQFALMEMQLVLATVVQHYRLSLVPDQRIELEPLLSLRPRGGVHVTLTEQTD